MCLGALVHAGVPLNYLVEQLERLGIADEYQLRTELVHRNGQQATKFHVELTTAPASEANSTSPDRIEFNTFAHHLHSAIDSSQAATHPHSHNFDHSTHTPTTPAPEINQAADRHTHGRHLPEIEQLIIQANLPERAATWSLEVFRRLAVAEGAVHGIAPEQVHFHEVGATDAIVDIVGTCLGLDWLGIEEFYCSALPTGGGTVRAAHGRLPVPTPAVLKLWESHQVPIYSNGIDRELVTPTGAAIAVTLAKRFGPPPPMILQQVGLGAGSRNLPIPNILRLWIGESLQPDTDHSTPVSHPHSHSTQRSGTVTTQLSASSQSKEQEAIALLETQIDDLNPQAIGYVFEVLFAAGALDVFTQAIGMKKSRPGILLSVVCHPEQVAACEAVLFRETSTLGIRQSLQQRTILQREIQSVVTEYGPIRVKVAWSGSDRPTSHTQPGNVQPEYEDCARIARQHQIPWREVHQLALRSWYQQQQFNGSAIAPHSHSIT